MRGGKRAGAGRKKGSMMSKTATIALKLADAGATPLDVLLSVMRDESQPLALRVDCAKSAAPFCHPRLAHVQVERKSNTELLQRMFEQVQSDRKVGTLIEQKPAEVVSK